MRWLLLFIGLSGLVATVWLQKPANSSFLAFLNGEVRVCPSSEVSSSPPDFQARACKTLTTNSLDLYRRLLWLEGEFDVSAELIESNRPIGFFWNAKAASRVFVNGQLVGSNGTPGIAPATEIAGSLDATFYVPRNLILPGQNTVTILASSQRGLWASRSPLLVARFDKYRAPPYHQRSEYWVSLLTFGVFLVGAVYFGASARFAFSRRLSSTLCFASIFACAQLLAEISRGMWAYSYPVHEARMVLVSLFSFGVGSALLSHTLDRFDHPRRVLWLMTTAAITATGLVVIPGFESKASWGILVPSIAASVICVAAIRAKKSAGPSYAATFAVFVLLILIDPGDFLDQYYYLVLAGVLVCLFIQQAFAHKEALRDYQLTEVARQRLEVIVDNMRPSPPVVIDVKDANTVHRVAADELEWCCSAGDYVALHLSNGRTLLHTLSLTSLEELLPSHFLRVHRSSIVNIYRIANLTRSDSGTGELSMLSGEKVPVSRRIMPHVRRSLDASAGSSNQPSPGAVERIRSQS